ncbi:DUF6404 family protein [Bradyrhizobium sp. SZCCHNS3052]|uniref:DUF6404 family protein n=1 Tax=Bradyrhizobium sp. SZCCHNS3052 TaxID=3057321 RepID=UPI002916D7F4|nr:DUF6404 family protein [Bradyrhizobium sp. SZCCHNS3052]
MSSPSRLDSALAILAATGMWRSSYEPPLYRLLWRLGLPLPPPHFASFGFNFAFTAAWFGTAWGAIMWIFVWSKVSGSGVVAITGAVVAGVLFGLIMAAHYRYGARKYKLPLWSEVNAGP